MISKAAATRLAEAETAERLRAQPECIQRLYRNHPRQPQSYEIVGNMVIEETEYERRMAKAAI